MTFLKTFIEALLWVALLICLLVSIGGFFKMLGPKAEPDDLKFFCLFVVASCALFAGLAEIGAI